MENFKIVDLKIGETKEHKNYYYAVLYSNLGYLVNCYISEDDYNFLLVNNYFEYDLTNILSKRYNKNNNSFSYYLKLN